MSRTPPWMGNDHSPQSQQLPREGKIIVTKENVVHKKEHLTFCLIYFHLFDKVWFVCLKIKINIIIQRSFMSLFNRMIIIKSSFQWMNFHSLFLSWLLLKKNSDSSNNKIWKEEKCLQIHHLKISKYFHISDFSSISSLHVFRSFVQLPSFYTLAFLR